MPVDDDSHDRANQAVTPERQGEARPGVLPHPRPLGMHADWKASRAACQRRLVECRLPTHEFVECRREPPGVTHLLQQSVIRPDERPALPESLHVVAGAHQQVLGDADGRSEEIDQPRSRRGPAPVHPEHQDPGRGHVGRPGRGRCFHRSAERGRDGARAHRYRQVPRSTDHPTTRHGMMVARSTTPPAGCTVAGSTTDRPCVGIGIGVGVGVGRTLSVGPVRRYSRPCRQCRVSGGGPILFPGACPSGQPGTGGPWSKRSAPIARSPRWSGGASSSATRGAATPWWAASSTPTPRS